MYLGDLHIKFLYCNVTKTIRGSDEMLLTRGLLIATKLLVVDLDIFYKFLP